MKQSNWRIALNIILELGTHRGDVSLGIGTPDIIKHFKLDKPDASDAAVRVAISTAIKHYRAPIAKAREGRFVRYYVPLGSRKAARILLKNPTAKNYRIVETPSFRDQVAAKSTACHPPGANNPPPTVKGEPVKVYADALPGPPPIARYGAPKDTPAPRTIRSENCLYLIQARAPRSLSCEDIADFFFISLEEAAQVLTAAAAKYGHLVEITMHARIKK